MKKVSQLYQQVYEDNAEGGKVTDSGSCSFLTNMRQSAWELKERISSLREKLDGLEPQR